MHEVGGEGVGEHRAQHHHPQAHAHIGAEDVAGTVNLLLGRTENGILDDDN